MTNPSTYYFWFNCHAISFKSSSILFFAWLVLLISIIPSHMSNMINSFGMKIVKAIIIDITKVYTIKTYIIAKECNNIWVYITKDYIIIRKYINITVFNNLTCNKPTRNKFNVSIEDSLETNLSYISWVIYWSGTKAQVSTTLSNVSWVLPPQKQIVLQKDEYRQLESWSNREQS